MPGTWRWATTTGRFTPCSSMRGVSSKQLGHRDAEAGQMRIAGQVLPDVDQLRLLPGAVDQHRTVVRVDDPDQGDPGVEISVELLVDQFLRIAGREVLNDQHRNTLNEGRSVRLTFRQVR